MEPGSPWLFLVLLFLLFLSAFFSASETSLGAINKIRLKTLADENVKNAKLAQKLTDSPQKLLSAILVGNNIVNIAASSLATSIALFYSPKNGVGIATVAMTVAVLIFGEITPKTLASKKAEKVALAVAKIINFVVFLSTPIVTVLNLFTNRLLKLLGADDTENAPGITEAELKTMVDIGHEEGVIKVYERRMINNVFDFDDSKAKDIMTPRTDMVAISDKASYAEVADMFNRERFSRLPVYHDNTDDITGILYVKDIAFIDEASFDIKKYAKEPFFTYETKKTVQLFSHMRQKRIPVAIVLDEYGGTSGIITIEDIVQEIVGDLPDYDDEEEKEEIRRQSDDEYIIDAAAKLDDVNEILDANLISEDFDTIGGYALDLFGRFPEVGEVVTKGNIEITITQADKNRIDEIKLKIYDEDNALENE